MEGGSSLTRSTVNFRHKCRRELTSIGRKHSCPNQAAWPTPVNLLPPNKIGPQDDPEDFLKLFSRKPPRAEPPDWGRGQCWEQIPPLSKLSPCHTFVPLYATGAFYLFYLLVPCDGGGDNDPGDQREGINLH